MDTVGDPLDYYDEETLSVDMLRQLYPLLSSKIEDTEDFSKLFGGIINIVLSDYCLDERIIDWLNVPYSGHAVLWLKVFSQPSSLILQQFKLQYMERLQASITDGYGTKLADNQNQSDPYKVEKEVKRELKESSTQTDGIAPNNLGMVRADGSSPTDSAAYASPTEHSSVVTGRSTISEEMVEQTRLSLSSLDEREGQTISIAINQKLSTSEDISLNVKQEIVDESYDTSIITSANTEPTIAIKADDSAMESLEINKELHDQVRTADGLEDNAMDKEEDFMPGIGLVTSVSIKAEPMEFESSADSFAGDVEPSETDEILIPHDHELVATTSNNSQSDIANLESASALEQNAFDFYCHSCRQLHTYHSSTSRYRYVCWTAHSGRCPSMFMTCRMVAFVKHKKTAHPPGTIFEVDQAAIRKRLRKAKKLYYKNAEEPADNCLAVNESFKSMTKTSNVTDSSSVPSLNTSVEFYCCSCELVHRRDLQPLYRCVVGSANCLYTYEACNLDAISKHQSERHVDENCSYLSETLNSGHPQQSGNPLAHCQHCHKDLRKYHEMNFVCCISNCPYKYKSCTVERMRAHHNILHSKKQFFILQMSEKQKRVEKKRYQISTIQKRTPDAVTEVTMGETENWNQKSALPKPNKGQVARQTSAEEFLCFHCRKDMRDYHDRKYVCCVQKCKYAYRACTVKQMTEHHSIMHADRAFKIAKTPLRLRKAERKRFVKSATTQPPGLFHVEHINKDYSAMVEEVISENVMTDKSASTLLEGHVQDSSTDGSKSAATAANVTSYKCAHCDFTCASKPELNDHVAIEHVNVKPSLCEDCNEVLGTQHDTNFRCSWQGCGFNTCSENVLSIHKKISFHRDKKASKTAATAEGSMTAARDGITQMPFEKDVMSILDATNTPYTLTNGVRLYRPIKLEKIKGCYKCPVCDYRSTATHNVRISLTAHVKHHQDDQLKIRLDSVLFSCEICGQKLDDSHKIFYCDCQEQRVGGGYCRMNDLLKHIRKVHTDWKIEVTYSCPFCDKTAIGVDFSALMPHLTEHGPCCLVCKKIPTAGHKYGHAKNAKTKKSFVACSAGMISGFEIKRTCKITKPESKHEVKENVPGTSERMENIALNPPHPDENAVITTNSTDPDVVPLVAISCEADPDRCTNTERVQRARKRTGRPPSKTLTRYSSARSAANSDLSGDSESDESEHADNTSNFYKIKDESSPYQCYFCGYTTAIGVEINSHIAEAHVDQQNYTCRFCPSYKASRKANWTYHMVSAHQICTHVLDAGKSDKVHHATDAGQMMYLAINSDVSSCAQCSFKYAEEVSKDFTRKRGRPRKHPKQSPRRATKRAKRNEEQRIVTGGVKGSRESNDTPILKAENSFDDDTLSEENVALSASEPEDESERESEGESEYQESSESEQYDDDHDSDEDYNPNTGDHRSKSKPAKYTSSISTLTQPSDGNLQTSDKKTSFFSWIKPNTSYGGNLDEIIRIKPEQISRSSQQVFPKQAQVITRNGVTYALVQQSGDSNLNSSKPIKLVTANGQSLIKMPFAGAINPNISTEAAVSQGVKPPVVIHQKSISSQQNQKSLLSSQLNPNIASGAAGNIQMFNQGVKPPVVIHQKSISSQQILNIASSAARNIQLFNQTGRKIPAARLQEEPRVLSILSPSKPKTCTPTTFVKNIVTVVNKGRESGNPVLTAGTPIKVSVAEKAASSVPIQPHHINPIVRLSKYPPVPVPKVTSVGNIMPKIVVSNLNSTTPTMTITAHPSPVPSSGELRKIVSKPPSTPALGTSGSLDRLLESTTHYVVKEGFGKQTTFAASGTHRKPVSAKCNSCMKLLIGFDMNKLIAAHERLCTHQPLSLAVQPQTTAVTTCQSRPVVIGPIRDRSATEHGHVDKEKVSTEQESTKQEGESTEQKCPKEEWDSIKRIYTEDEQHQHDDVAITNEPILELI